MDKQDWYNMGTQIGDLVQSAIDNQDFQQLNQSITKAISDTLDLVQKNVQDGLGQAAGGGKAAPNSWRAAYERAAGRKTGNTEEWKRNPNGSGETKTPGQAYRRVTKTEQGYGRIFYQDEREKQVSKSSSKALKSYKGVTYMAVGYTFTGIFGIGALVLGLLTRVAAPLLIPTAICLALTGGFLGMGVKGSRFHARLKRQKQYLQIMGERDTCTLEELAAGTGKSKKYVAKDLREMIQNHMFPQGAYLDAQNTCLMTSHSAYQLYQQAEKQYEQRKAEESSMPELSGEIRDILREGKEFITHIHQCNDALPGEEISEKLSRLEAVVTKIFDQVEKKPESAPDLHKMMSYYLPITRKLVDAYRDLDAQQVSGQNIVKTKKEIEDSLDTINTAFENLLDSFFQDTAWDVSSDITVLHTMMAQDGLMKKDFSSAKKEEV